MMRTSGFTGLVTITEYNKRTITTKPVGLVQRESNYIYDDVCINISSFPQVRVLKKEKIIGPIVQVIF